MKRHSLKPGDQAVEVRDADGSLLCAIYQTPRGIKIVSRLIQNTPDLVVIHPGTVPAILVNLR